MRRGDLVKHPGGIKNVCEKTYSMGVVLSIHSPRQPPGEAQVEVMWRGILTQRGLVYHESQLEVISENR